MSHLLCLALIVLTMEACSNELILSANLPDSFSDAVRDSASLPPTTQDKVSRHLSELLEQIRSRKLTRQSMTSTEAASLSSQLVRVNSLGQIQVYIDVAEVNEEVITRLKEKEATVELSDPSLRVVQAWIPFDRISDVAAMKSVRRIRPPDYAIPRN